MPDPDVEIRGVGKGRSSRPLDKGGGGGWAVSNNFFWPFGPQFGPKIRGGGPPGPSTGSASGLCDHSNKWYEKKLHFWT